MAVTQEKGQILKVRPVFDYRILNTAVESHPAGALPACNDQLRTWRQLGEKWTIVDLKKAYLQICIDL